MREQARSAPEDHALSLAGVALLRHLRAEERAYLATRCTYRRIDTGQVILDRFSASAGIFFLLSGVARVVQHTVAGDEITIAMIPAGDTLGEISAIDGLARSATVVADEPCFVAELPRAEFFALLSRCGDVALDLLRRWAATIRRLSDKVTYLATGTPDQRVYGELLRLARPEAVGSARWQVAELPAHQELAKWAQTSREVVAGAVGELLRRGIAERRHRTLRILDFDMLKHLAAGGDRPQAARGASGEAPLPARP